MAQQILKVINELNSELLKSISQLNTTGKWTSPPGSFIKVQHTYMIHHFQVQLALYYIITINHASLLSFQKMHSHIKSYRWLKAVVCGHAVMLRAARYLIFMDPRIVDYSVEVPTRCSFVIEFIIPKFFEGSKCFERHMSGQCASAHWAFATAGHHMGI